MFNRELLELADLDNGSALRGVGEMIPHSPKRACG